MVDIWGFLLQTLTASGVAVLLLAVKGLFQDKLPPKWHFSVWGVLGLMLLLPAGFNGRYALFRWQIPVEVIKAWFSDYSDTRVLFPVPFMSALPRTLPEWLFAVYVLGIIVHAIRYTVSYIRLRRVLRGGTAPCGEAMARICQTAEKQGIKPCNVIAVPGLPGAFVCGILRPVLVIPQGETPDEKVILHELLHLKNKDTLWSAVICLLRCIHWCNPLLIHCANRALGDMESRCDQLVLEQLAGEERRDYGRILLSMVNDRFAQTPGSTCINNGGKQIRQRIEAIARFKKYPAGMGLVSVCVIILLAFSLATGAQATAVSDGNPSSLQISLAIGRSTPCTTPAGTFDTYGKAILDQNGVYRAMCAPASMQEQILVEMTEKDKEGVYPNWDCGLPGWPNTQSGYYIYNLSQVDPEAYEGLFVVEMNYPPDGLPGEEGKLYLAVQNLRVEKENGRWVAIPLEDFRSVEATEQSLNWGCPELPGITYAGTTAEFLVEVKVQTVHTVDNSVITENGNMFFGSSSYFDTTPKPNAEFDTATRNQSTSCTHLGTEEERNAIFQVGLSVAPVDPGETRPVLRSAATGEYSSGSSSNGENWTSRKTKPGWGPSLELGGGGTSFGPGMDSEFPEYYAADLYINNELAAQIDLYLQEGDFQ